MYWNIKEIEAPELAQWLEQKEGAFRVIDVRQPAEIAAGTVPGAEPLPLASLPMRLHEFDKDQELVLICHSGARSAQACMFLQQQGIDNVYNLRGGMLSWAANGLPSPLPQVI